jgi:hypothetical protein
MHGCVVIVVIFFCCFDFASTYNHSATSGTPIMKKTIIVRIGILSTNRKKNFFPSYGILDVNYYWCSPHGRKGFFSRISSREMLGLYVKEQFLFSYGEDISYWKRECKSPSLSWIYQIIYRLVIPCSINNHPIGLDSDIGNIISLYERLLKSKLRVTFSPGRYRSLALSNLQFSIIQSGFLSIPLYILVHYSL